MQGLGNPAKGTNSHASVWSSRRPAKEPGHGEGARPLAGVGASMASQTGGEGEPGHEVSGTPVREVSKVPEGRWDFVHGRRCWAAVPPQCLAPSFFVSKGLKHCLGHIRVAPSMMPHMGRVAQGL